MFRRKCRYVIEFHLPPPAVSPPPPRPARSYYLAAAFMQLQGKPASFRAAVPASGTTAVTAPVIAGRRTPDSRVPAVSDPPGRRGLFPRGGRDG